MKKLRRFIAALCAVLVLAEIGDLAFLYRARATINSSLSTVTALGNGSTTVFSFPFVGVAASDITVIFTDATGAQTTLSSSLYSLSLNAASPGQLWGVGGSVTYPLAGSP